MHSGELLFYKIFLVHLAFHRGTAGNPARYNGGKWLRRVNRLLANGADGISDIEGKAVTGSGEQAGTRGSFNGAAGPLATKMGKPRGRSFVTGWGYGRQLLAPTC